VHLLRLRRALSHYFCVFVVVPRSAGPTVPLLFYVYKADGGPHVCLLFAFRNCPIATPHGASEVHSRSGPDFKVIAPSNILRTRGSGRINSLQIRLSIGLRTRATCCRPSSPCIRVPDMGYMIKEMDCGTRQLFGAFRRQTFERPACMSGSNPSRWPSVS